MSEARCYVEISRGQIARNYLAVRDAVGSRADLIGVVKADAYGHGMLEVARILIGLGARWLAVSSVGEGVRLREAGVRADVLVMAGVLPSERAAAVALDLAPVAHSLEDIEAFDEAAVAAGKALRFHLKLDTGMARLGTRASVAEIAQKIAALRLARCEGLMSHFASASDFESNQTVEQVARFVELTGGLREAGVVTEHLHFASSNAIAYAQREVWPTLVRPGHAIYGYLSPAKGLAPVPDLQVAPALSWKAKIVAVKEVPVGTRVGYGGTATTQRPTRMAILSAGYADGIPHRLSNRGRVIAAGKLVPILGTVSMDLTTIDITDCVGLRPGDDVTLLGREGDVSLNAQEIARVAGTISYNVLCGIKPRVERVYVD